jgi:malonyl-CoA O-methyltransferase
MENIWNYIRKLNLLLQSKLGRDHSQGDPTRSAQTYRKALEWVHDNSVYDNSMDGSGICVHHNRQIPYPEVTGYFIPTLLDYGEQKLAAQFTKWLVSVQNRDGSWSDPSGKMPYTFDTGQVLKGLLSILPRLPECENAIHRGCEWMLAQISPSGRITTPDKSAWRLPTGKLVSENIHLYGLEPLFKAGDYFGEPRYVEAVDRALSYYLVQPDLTHFNTLSHFHAYVLEGLVDLGCREEASQGMMEVECRQRKDGGVPAYPDVDWLCSVGLAQYAVIWYKLGQRGLAHKAFAYLCNIQNPSGGFFGSYGHGANYFRNEEISWAVKFFLDAYHWHVRTAFDVDVNRFPASMNENDGRLQAVLNGLGDLSHLRILDAGCGKGRLARALLARYPSAEIWGLDLSEALLRYVPQGVKTRQGSLLNLPFEDGFFDHVYCVEALEHALNPEAAIGELCRVVTPEGSIVIVDKNADHLGTLEIEKWERWFCRNEVETWLSRFCTDVTSEFISYGGKTEPDGLFISWQGRRGGVEFAQAPERVFAQNSA